MWVISDKNKVRIHNRDRFFYFGVVGEHQGRFNGECGFEWQVGSDLDFRIGGAKEQ